MDLNLKNKNAIVCGSSKGIGKAIAIELANLGANVILISRNVEVLKKVCDVLHKEENQKHNYLMVDFSNPGILRNSINRFISENPPIHILINNTGGPKAGEAYKADTLEYFKAFEMHLICNQILVQAVLKGMKSENYGRIVNIISTSVKQPIKGLGVSNTIRGAVASWSKTLASELGSFGITVNNILPGATTTERLTLLIESKAKSLNKSIDEIKTEMLQEIPAGRFGESEEIAYAVAFLCSPAASYINGVNLVIDGGRTVCL